MKFDLELAIRIWRKELNHHESLEPENMEELEDHLRSMIEELIVEGHEESIAFDESLRRLGLNSQVLNNYQNQKTRPSFLLGMPVFFRFALRRILKRNTSSFVNIVGLSISTAAFLLISIYIFHETHFDQFHDKKDRLYRVSMELKNGEEVEYAGAGTFSATGPMLRDHLPEVINHCRLFKIYRPGTVRVDDQFFRESNLYFADPSFLEMFSFPVLDGNKDYLLQNPNTAIIDANTAERYFGDENPIGKKVTIGTMDGNRVVEITGVFQSVRNSHLEFAMIFPFQDYTRMFPSAENSWRWYDFYNYVELEEDGAISEVLEKIPELLDLYSGDRLGSSRLNLKLQPVTDIYLHSDLVYEPGPSGDARMLQILGIIGLSILIIAWINYINLTTARSMQRVKEIGVRKALGSGKRSIYLQFLMETFMINWVALVIAIMIFIFTIPYFNQLANVYLTAEILWNWKILLLLIANLVIGTIIAGIYPAKTLTSFQVIPALRGLARFSTSSVSLRKVLVIGQFMISASLISFTLIIRDQVSFLETQGLKLSTENMIVMRAPDAIEDPRQHALSMLTLRDQLANHSGIAKASVSSEFPGKAISWWGGVRLMNQRADERITLYRVGIDQHYLPLYRAEFAAGRNFDGNDEGRAILNETAIRNLGFEDPMSALNKMIVTGRDTLQIQGVVKDFHQELLKFEIQPTLYLPDVPLEMKFLVVELAETQYFDSSSLEALYHEVFPEASLDLFFVDQHLESQLSRDQSAMAALLFFSVVAILIAMLGLLGLTIFINGLRSKEIAIRKILGANSVQLFKSLSYAIFQNVIIANLMSIPLILWLKELWLADFAYRSTFSWIVFLIACLITFLITLMTVVSALQKTITFNPAEKLRSE